MQKGSETAAKAELEGPDGHARLEKTMSESESMMRQQLEHGLYTNHSHTSLTVGEHDKFSVAAAVSEGMRKVASAVTSQDPMVCVKYRHKTKFRDVGRTKPVKAAQKSDYLGYEDVVFTERENNRFATRVPAVIGPHDADQLVGVQ